MSSFVNLFTNRKKIELYHVDFQYLGTLSENIDVHLSDRATVLSKDDKMLKVLITRRINFEPQNLFAIEASYYVEHYLKEEFIGKINWGEYNIENELISNIDYFSDHQMNRLSLLIAQTLSSFGNSPIITPPTFKKDR